jgi:hypothetical protein
MKKILASLNFGNSVAEFDDSLEKYFVENQAFDDLINDKVDIVAGDKGTGKTALFQILNKRYGSIKALAGVEVLAGFNPAGSPIFQKLVREQVLTEGQYASVWKAYVVALGGNWALDIAGRDHSPSFQLLAEMLDETGLMSKDDKPETIFAKIINAVQRTFIPKEVAMEFTISETGVPIITPKISFGKKEEQLTKEVSHDDALRLLDRCLGELGFSLWIVLDRLDEAFQGFPAVEIPALRALLRTYLDLLPYKNVRLKLFVRRDLLNRITEGGFVNLTHINERKVEIKWEEADLLYLLCRRIRDNKDVMKLLAKENEPPISDEELFYKIFPNKVDQATRKPTTWNWMMKRIRDGNKVYPPRNLIGLTKNARDEQLKIEGRAPRPFVEGTPLITSEALRAALGSLSETRVQDTLLAEAIPQVSNYIQKFKKQRAEHNQVSLTAILGLQGEPLNYAVSQLVQIGFLEELKTTWKVPMLYRDGLKITQGKAFQTEASPEESDEDDE